MRWVRWDCVLFVSPAQHNANVHVQRSAQPMGRSDPTLTKFVYVDTDLPTELLRPRPDGPVPLATPVPRTLIKCVAHARDSSACTPAAINNKVGGFCRTNRRVRIHAGRDRVTSCRTLRRDTPRNRHSSSQNRFTEQHVNTVARQMAHRLL